MRAIVLAEETLCYVCLGEGRTTASREADHKVPKCQGGTDDRENYGGICTPCHKIKTARESAEARQAAKRPALTFGRRRKG